MSSDLYLNIPHPKIRDRLANGRRKETILHKLLASTYELQKLKKMAMYLNIYWQFKSKHTAIEKNKKTWKQLYLIRYTLSPCSRRCRCKSHHLTFCHIHLSRSLDHLSYREIDHTSLLWSDDHGLKQNYIV